MARFSTSLRKFCLLRKSESGSSTVTPYHQVTLSLSVNSKKGLGPILDSLIAEQETGGWDGEFERRVILEETGKAMLAFDGATYALPSAW